MKTSTLIVFLATALLVVLAKLGAEPGPAGAAPARPYPAKPEAQMQTVLDVHAPLAPKHL